MTNAFDQSLHRALRGTFSRRGLLKGGIAGAAGALVLSAFAGTAFAAPAANYATSGVTAGPLDSDLEILNYALTLELLEADAYATALSLNVLTGRALAYFKDFAAHEAAHVAAVTATITQLGGTPVAKPAGGYNYASVPRTEADLVKFFQVVESVGASAYLGAAPSVKNLDVLAAALSIHASEAQHTAALADLVAPGTDLFAPESFATPRTPTQVVAIVTPFFTPATAPATPPTTPGMPNTGAGFASGFGSLAKASR